MPLINNQIEFTEEESQLIDNLKAIEDYDHTKWNADSLIDLRSKIRRFYRLEQQGICAFCKNEISLVAANNANVEHIAPKSKHLDFMFEPKNLCVICVDCNIIKRAQEVVDAIETVNAPEGRARYPRASRAFNIVHPHIDEYDDHIKKLGRIYIDKTMKGHFTIGCCKLNRFYHQFDIEDEFIDDVQLNELMARFQDSDSAIEKGQILAQIRDGLINM